MSETGKERAEALLPFLKEVDRLKAIERQTLVHNGGRRENSAEHSWHLALAVLVFHRQAEASVDLGKALKMALLHDLVEIDAGDTFFYGDSSGKAAAEAAAAARILGLLPREIGCELEALWREFDEGASPEARFVSALDRFLPLFSNDLNDGYSWRNHEVTAEQVRKRCRGPIEGALPALWQVALEMIARSAPKG